MDDDKVSITDLYTRCHKLFKIVNGELIRRTTLSHNAKEGDVAGWSDKEYYRVRIDRKIYLVHRIIYLMSNGDLPDVIDHVDGNTANNQPNNLRESCKETNRWNSKGNKGSISGYKGVYQDGKKWKALITRKGKRYYLGMHDTKELAANAVECKSKELSGDFHKKII